LKKDLHLIKEIKKHIKNLHTPVDLAVSVNGKREEISLEELPTKYQILDIGKETIKLYSEEIRKSKAIFLKGTPGYSQDSNFSFGTKKLLEIISKSKSYSVVAGGSSSAAVDKFKINKKGINYISLSGGALVYYLAGKKLPGLENLKKR